MNILKRFSLFFLLVIDMASEVLIPAVFGKEVVLRRVKASMGLISAADLSGGVEIKREEFIGHLERTGSIIVGTVNKENKIDHILILKRNNYLFRDNELVYQFLNEIGTETTHIVKEKDFFGLGENVAVSWNYRYYWLKNKIAPWAKKLVDIGLKEGQIRVTFGRSNVDFPGRHGIERIDTGRGIESMFKVDTTNLGSLDSFKIHIPLTHKENGLLSLSAVLSLFFDYKFSGERRGIEPSLEYPRIWVEIYDGQNSSLGSKSLRDFSAQNKFFKFPLGEEGFFLSRLPDVKETAYLVITVRFSSPGMFYMKDIWIE